MEPAFTRPQDAAASRNQVVAAAALVMDDIPTRKLPRYRLSSPVFVETAIFYSRDAMYANAAPATTLLLSDSDKSRYCTETAGRIKLIFGMDLSYTVF